MRRDDVKSILLRYGGILLRHLYPPQKILGGRPSVWDLKLLLQSHSIPKIDSTKCNTSVNATRYLKKFCAYIYARHLEGEKEGGGPGYSFFRKQRHAIRLLIYLCMSKQG